MRRSVFGLALACLAFARETADSDANARSATRTSDASSGCWPTAKTPAGLRQDPIEYGTFTWHTNLDAYERIVPEDVKNAAAVIAGAVWYVANRNEMLPRFGKDAMPAVTGATR